MEVEISDMVDVRVAFDSLLVNAGYIPRKYEKDNVTPDFIAKSNVYPGIVVIAECTDSNDKMQLAIDKLIRYGRGLVGKLDIVKCTCSCAMW